LASRRRRRKSVGKVIVSIEDRLRRVETRPGALRLKNNVVTSKKLGYRAVVTKTIADSAVTPKEAGFGVNYVSATDPEAALLKAGATVTNPGDGSTKVWNEDTGDFVNFADPVAQEAAENAQYDATAAIASAGGRNRIFYQTTAPTSPINGYALVTGDTWFDTSADYKLSKWNGTAWSDAPLGDGAFANISVTKLLAGNIAAGQYIQAGASNSSARIILAPAAGSSGGYSWDGGLSIYSGASTKSFYADMSGNLTLTGATIKSTSSTSASRISITSSSFQIFEYSSGADKKLVNFSTSTGALYFLNDSLRFDWSNLITGSGATQILAAQTDIYYRAVENDGTFISGSTNGYIRQRTEKTGASFSSFPCGPDQYFQSYEIVPATIPGFYRPPGVILTNNLFEYGRAAADDTGTGEGAAKHAVHIQGQVGNHFTLSSTVYAVKSIRNTYVIPSSVSTSGFSTHSDGIVDGEILLQYTP